MKNRGRLYERGADFRAHLYIAVESFGGGSSSDWVLMDLIHIIYKYFRKKLDSNFEDSASVKENGEEQAKKSGNQDREYFQ